MVSFSTQSLFLENEKFFLLCPAIPQSIRLVVLILHPLIDKYSRNIYDNDVERKNFFYSRAADPRDMKVFSTKIVG